MNSARDFREQARKGLGGRWLPAVGTTLVASLLGADITMSSANAGSILLNTSSGDGGYLSAYFDQLPLGTLVAVLLGLLSLSMVWLLVAYLIGSFVSLGLMRYNLDLIDGKEVHFGQIFSMSSLCGKALWLNIRTSIFTFLWSLCLIIPGIIKTYSYSMAGFIMTENPEMTAKEAMEVSMKMMRGNKWRLFCLQLSFIGWAILAIFTLGIGYLWLTPYVNAATAAFYDEISRVPIEA